MGPGGQWQRPVRGQVEAADKRGHKLVFASRLQLGDWSSQSQGKKVTEAGLSGWKKALHCRLWLRAGLAAHSEVSDNIVLAEPEPQHTSVLSLSFFRLSQLSVSAHDLLSRMIRGHWESLQCSNPGWSNLFDKQITTSTSEDQS